MSKITKALLWLLGWRWVKSRDSRGSEYVSFLRRFYGPIPSPWVVKKPAYFHVYHEATEQAVLRPQYQKRTQ